MSEQHIDPEYADPMSGSGIAEDDYGEQSWADDTATDEGDDRLELDEEGSKKKSGEANYSEKLDGGRAGADETELDKLTRSIRNLQDAKSYRLGIRLHGKDDEELYLDYLDGSDRQEILGSWSKITGSVDWVNLPEDHPLLDIPIDWETKARMDQTEAVPLGMDPRWATVDALVEGTWMDGRRHLPTIKGSPYALHEHELSRPEADAIREITLSLVEDESFQPDQIKRVRHEVRMAQGRIFEEETRGGAREQGVPGKAKRCYPDGHLSGPFCYFDFTTRQHGKGAAREDARAIKKWLAGQLIEEDGRRWLIESEAGPYSIEDYKRALAPGRKDNQEMQAMRRELAIRVKELKEDGAYMTAIAKKTVLDTSERTIRRMVR